MRNRGLFHVILFSCVLCLVTCESVSDPMNSTVQPGKSALSKPGIPQIATGTVEIIWKGGQGTGAQQHPPKLAFADFNAHEEFMGNPAMGEFIFRVLNADSTLHREVVVQVDHVYVDEFTSKAYFSGMVLSDSRGCAGNGGGGHSSGCSGGGCGGGHTNPTGGCSGHDSGHDEGCSGDDGGDHSAGCSGGSGGTGGTGGQSGQGAQCKIGQMLVAKVHDVGTPGTSGDGMTWKWFDAEDPDAPAPADETTVGAWPHLCKKTIIAGNLKVHF